MDDESTLNFVAAQPNSGAHDLPPQDSDLASWLVMNGDLLGSSRAFDMDEPLLMGGYMDPLGPSSYPAQRHVQHGSQHHQHQHAHHHQLSSLQLDTSLLPEDDSLVMQRQPEQVAPRPPAPRTTRRSARTAAAANASSAASSSSSPSSMRIPKAPSANKRSHSEDSDDYPVPPGVDPNDPKYKRQRRLEKNREIARNCRKRKREKYQKLEEEVDYLRQYTKQLESQLNKGRDGRDREVARKAELKGMQELLDQSSAETEMKKRLNSYKEMYSDFGRERGSAITYHMSKLKSLLIPNTVSKMTIWSLQQDDEFYDEKKNQKTFGGGIWNMLTSELQLTDEQKKTLLGMRHGVRAQRRNVAECLRILRELESRVSGNFDSMSKQMDEVMSTITPAQQARFLLWIEKNKACTFMLNNMWNPVQNETDASVGTGTSEDELDDSASTMGMSVASEVSSKVQSVLSSGGKAKARATASSGSASSSPAAAVPVKLEPQGK